MPEEPEMVRFFLSYAREDLYFLQALVRAFTSLNNIVNHNIISFSDKDIEVGSSINSTIKDKLVDTDTLVLINTETRKDVFGYTGWEFGYFQGLIDGDRKTFGTTSRRIVAFFLKHPPAPARDTLGIDIGLERTELELGRVEYLDRTTRDVPEDITANPFTNFMFEVTQLAEKRRPSVGTPKEKKERAEEIEKAIKEEIYPALRGDIYDCICSRVEREDLEQLSIKIEFPKRSSDIDPLVINDDATVTIRAKNGSVFSTMFASESTQCISWKEFKAWVQRVDEPYGNVVYAIEKTLKSAIETNEPVDNDQVIRSPGDGKLYRIIVTEHVEFFDGRRTIYMWLIPSLTFKSFGNPKTTILLSFIVLSAKYRFLFLEKESQFALKKLKAIKDPAELKGTVLAILRELVLIEEESRAMDLDGSAAFLAIVSKKIKNQIVEKHMGDYQTTRKSLQAAASGFIEIDPDSLKFSETTERWWASLEAFVAASRVVNETYTASALENLGKQFRPNISKPRGKPTRRAAVE
ncbi:hypothetical protein ELH21_10735 [Rhizobium leguminosarum]|uniref:hypothetical protein n=1 Tax=Rhizobium leguminosarum TaxID=384 RepID=UPI00102FAA7A|nr:hypothetical protein [Rhizobium leguminosarum]TBD04828.1 hypothetical protein ELH21_10735 [Rhizobium leguminosarum]